MGVMGKLKIKSKKLSEMHEEQLNWPNVVDRKLSILSAIFSL